MGSNPSSLCFTAARGARRNNERQNPRRQADGRREEKARRATAEPDELPLLEVRPAEARARLPLPAAGREGPDGACGSHQECGRPGRNGRAVGRAACRGEGSRATGDTAAAAAGRAAELFAGRLRARRRTTYFLVIPQAKRPVALRYATRVVRPSFKTHIGALCSSSNKRHGASPGMASAGQYAVRRGRDVVRLRGLARGAARSDRGGAVCASWSAVRSHPRAPRQPGGAGTTSRGTAARRPAAST